MSLKYAGAQITAPEELSSATSPSIGGEGGSVEIKTGGNDWGVKSVVMEQSGVRENKILKVICDLFICPSSDATFKFSIPCSDFSWSICTFISIH